MGKRKIIVRFDEIGLKGGNRSFFINKLVSRIKAVLPHTRVEVFHDRLILTPDREDDLLSSAKKASHIFGVAYTAPVISVEPEISAIEKNILSQYSGKLSVNRSFRLTVSRADKEFPLNSVQTANRIGQAIVDKYAIKVDLENPELTLYIDITKEAAYIYTKKLIGPGGLPVGSSGKGLLLLSGGIDSAVAAYKLLRRGLKLTYLHFHALPPKSNFVETPPAQIVKILSKSQGISADIYFLPYHHFQLALVERRTRAELVLFRRFMLRAGEKLARENDIPVLVTGDNLGQVASQTLKNLTAADAAVETTIFRPLIGENKQEIIDLAKRIGTYEISIGEYKDCCSIIDRHPATKTTVKRLKQLELSLPLEKVVSQTLSEQKLLTL